MFFLDEDKLIITNREAAEIKKILETPFESEPSAIFEDIEDSNSEEAKNEEPGVVTNVNLSDESKDNKVLTKERATDRIQKISKIQGSSARKPVYGILTEPLQGVLQTKRAEKAHCPSC